MPTTEAWKTSVTFIDNGTIAYRERPIGPLIEEGKLEDVLWTLLFGSPPSAEACDALRRALVSSLDHGLAAPATLTARATASTRGPIPLAVAAGLIAFAGPAHGGAAEGAGKVFERILESGPDVESAAVEVVDEMLASGRRIPGYGHPYHDADPRVEPLLAGTAPDRRHREVAANVERALERAVGRRLAMNADAAVAALLMDVGLVPRDVGLVTCLGRAFGLASHAREEQESERPFRAPGLSSITYEPSHASREGVTR